MGYRGVNQFWFGIQAPDARNYGMELNNQINEIATSEKLLPASGFKVYNATLIGAGTSSTLVNGGRNAAMIFRPFLGVTIENSIFTDFNERAIELDTRNTISAANVVTNTGHLKNNLWWGFVTGSGSANVNNTITNISRNTIASNYWSVAAFNNQIANPLLVSISRTNVGATLDPRPQADSPALSDVALTPIDGFLTTVNYRGAFAPGQGNWLGGWTALSEYQIVTGNGGIHPIDAPTGAVVPTLVPVITSAATATTTVGQSFSYTITADNVPTSFAATGLPTGLSINPDTGVISGTPTTVGSSTITINASNAGGIGSQTLLLTVSLPPMILINYNVTRNVFELMIKDEAAQEHTIEYTDNFQSWTALPTKVVGSTDLTLIDPQATNKTHRFYRVIKQ
jgi:hypothetical protein